MLSQVDNELLTRTNPNTPMGALFRRYWIPLVVSTELQPDGPPVKVRILGETVIAFRDTEGRVGVVEEACPHRGTSMAFAINEECGLRCIYHGWKFNVKGECVDLPSEPPESNFRHKVKLRSYPVYEGGNVVWTYLGPDDDVPPVPAFAWMDLPDSHRVVERVWQECNYLQVMENDLDFVHAAFLHRAKHEQPVKEGVLSSDLGISPSHPLVKNPYPRQVVEDTVYGQRYLAIGEADESNQVIMEIHYVFPFFTYPPRFAGEDMIFHAFVPMDDENTWSWDVHFNLTRPIDAETHLRRRGLWLDEQKRKLRNRSNNYLQDREMMKRQNFSGILGIANQDHAVTEAMGPIVDRSREHLGTSDIPLIGLRRMMLQEVRRFQNGAAPLRVNPEIVRKVYSCGAVAPKGIPWQEANPLEKEFMPTH
ncbi:Rieske 2Fe-2S domain-containing protein [Kyrpidia spormannii]|uniref:Rieske (2Fe-2S) protein n=1 Tax=Kyrpidia spormannii TaxID=2055160 RepID=A0A6F9EC75_9BACL|nr:Rieske 2Fe-2S domain-containing protein [Kyrpidia spormannii]CAB3394471.1 Rieske (2Fe-2S) protein [Kyrpidia spormannii]